MQVMYAQCITVRQLSQRQKNSLMFIRCISLQSRTHYTQVLAEQRCAEQHWHQLCPIISSMYLLIFILIPILLISCQVSLPSVSKTASQHYQGTFSCSVKRLLCHLQQHSSLNAPNYCKDARKTRKVHKLQ